MNSLDRQMPHDLPAEQRLAGGPMLNPAMLPEILESLSPAAFYNPLCRAVFEAEAVLFERSEPVDGVTIAGVLRASGATHIGMSQILDIYAGMPHFTDPSPYIKRVQDCAVRRELFKEAVKIQEDACDESNPVSEVLDRAGQGIFNLAADRITGGFIPLEVLTDEALDRASEHSVTGLRGLSTGYSDLDHMLAGFQKGDSIILAGRPSSGKTALALSLAQNIILAGGRCGFFSLEMSGASLADRMLSSMAQVDSHRLRSRFLSQEDWTRLAQARERIVEQRLLIDDTASLKPLELRARLRRLMATTPVDCIFIDYLQLMVGPKSESRQQEISAISRELKALAKEMNVPVITLSQLSRAPELRTDHRPVLADLRESGSIEQDADVVLLIYREEVYHPREDNVGLGEIIIAKQRSGPIGSVTLAFLKQFVRWETYRE